MGFRISSRTALLIGKFEKDFDSIKRTYDIPMAVSVTDLLT